MLRELGAPKRLGLLIEGESLLNDGTAIVLFSILLASLTGQSELSASGAAARFLFVAGGGVLLGLVLALITAWLLSRVFNQALIEIGLTILLAYAAMLIAEGFLHVSGVIAVVTAGLWLKGPARTNLSPEVAHSLHEVWSNLGDIANTLIFYLVGLVLGVQLGPALSAADRWVVLAMIGATFLTIVLLRGALLFLLRPALAWVGAPVNRAQTLAMAWGGLRGAVSLALALIVARTESLPQAFRDQLLLLSAGVVLLTILVNGMTMGALLRALGFDRAPPEQQLLGLAERLAISEAVAARVSAAFEREDLRAVKLWELERSLAGQRLELSKQLAALEEELGAASPEARLRATWTWAIGIERESHWHSFAEGLLSSKAVQLLENALDLELDQLKLSELPARLRRDSIIPSWRLTIAERLSPNRLAARLELQALRYELCRSAARAAQRVLAELSSVRSFASLEREAIRRAFEDDWRRNIEGIEDLRRNLPELTSTVETRLALRLRLNIEREELIQRARGGAIDPSSLSRAISEVELEMSRLAQRAPQVELPSSAELCRRSPLFAPLSEASLRQVAALAEELVYEPGALIMKQDDPGDFLILIARGAVAVTRHDKAHETELDKERDGEDQIINEKILDIAGAGAVLGELALLTGQPRSASLRAITTVTAVILRRAPVFALFEAEPALAAQVWRAGAERVFDTLARELPEAAALSHEQRQDWFSDAVLEDFQDQAVIPRRAHHRLVLFAGRIRSGETVLEAPQILNSKVLHEAQALSLVRLAWVPEHPPHARAARRTRFLPRRGLMVTP